MTGKNSDGFVAAKPHAQPAESRHLPKVSAERGLSGHHDLQGCLGLGRRVHGEQVAQTQGQVWFALGQDLWNDVFGGVGLQQQNMTCIFKD